MPVLAQMIWLGRSELRLLSCAVPDVKYLYTVCLLEDVVENAIRSKDNLPQWTLRASRVGLPDERKRCQYPNVVQDTVTQPLGRLRIIPGDVRAEYILRTAK